MARRRRTHTPPPSPLVGQGFPQQTAKRAAIQLVREIHRVHEERDTGSVERIIAEAIERARHERKGEP